MAKDSRKSAPLKEEKKIMVGFIYNCADIKFLVTSLLLIFILFTAIQFLPYKSLIILSPSNFVSYISNPTSKPSSSSIKSLTQLDKISNFTIKRSFNPIGSAAYLFIQMGAYRGGPSSFAVIGLASKPIHVYSDPKFACKWVPHGNSSAAINASLTQKMLPDWGYGRVYTVVVVNCTFDSNVGLNGSGGELIVTASTGGAQDFKEEFVSLEEKPKSVNFSIFESGPKYDYLYCGSPLYGNLSPQRVREWIAYHVKLFGKKSHFVIYDAGGVHREVLRVLKPWIEKGFVTLHDVRDQEMFDGYYHNQFLVVNDCLHKYRFDAKWMFFFDVDEFIYVDEKSNLDGFMKSMEGFTQFTIEQMPMSSKLCLTDDLGKAGRMWGMEKLIYKDVKRGIRRDRKYAIQPRNAYSAGVHLSQNFTGKTTHKTEGRIKYFHYHGTIATRREPCKEFVNSSELWYEKTPYYRDETLRGIAASIKMFELKSIGKALMRTRQ